MDVSLKLLAEKLKLLNGIDHAISLKVMQLILGFVVLFEKSIR